MTILRKLPVAVLLAVSPISILAVAAGRVNGPQMPGGAPLQEVARAR